MQTNMLPLFGCVLKIDNSEIIIYINFNLSGKIETVMKLSAHKRFVFVGR